MKYCKLDTQNLVVQVQPYFETGFIECGDEVCCGMVYDGVVFSKPIIVKSPQEQLQEISVAIQNLLDTKAQSLRYDNIMSARSYAGYTNPFQVEAQKLAVWGANCWVVAGQIEAAVIAGTRAIPTVAEVLLELPVYV